MIVKEIEPKLRTKNLELVHHGVYFTSDRGWAWATPVKSVAVCGCHK